MLGWEEKRFWTNLDLVDTDDRRLSYLRREVRRQCRPWISSWSGSLRLRGLTQGGEKGLMVSRSWW